MIVHGAQSVIRLLAIGALIVGGESACYYVPVEGYCCTTREACARPRGSGVITPCPAGQWCDNEGEYAEDGRSCISIPEGRCTTAADCPAALPACNPVSFTCERCDGDPACAGTSAARCDLDSGTCVECLVSSDCASEVCDEAARACLDPAGIIYVAADGVATGTCTQAQPCNTIQLGVSQLAADRSIIKVRPGTYAEQVTLNGVTATIVGDGAVVEPSSVPGFVVQDGAQVTIEGIRITGAQGAANPPGIRCQVVTAGAPTLHLRRVTLDNNSVGVAATNCALTIERSTISGNTRGGVSISEGTFTLTNNMIVANGSVTSMFGGVSIGQISAGSPHVFAFNTVTVNGGADGTVTGVECNQVTTPLVFSNNIVYGNQVTGAGSQVGGNNCSFTYSDIGPQTVAGTGNIDMDPLFVDPTSGNFHLQAASRARDTADPDATLAVDIDGDLRPHDGRSDMGADEVTE
jgi:Right handed beta helix region